MNNPLARKGTLPRHAAGSIELKGGTGPIVTMCPCGDFLEIYKTDMTFRVRTPESIDPHETNPHAPWVTSPVADVGSSNLSVARVLLQAREMLDMAVFDEPIDKDRVTAHLHGMKEVLLACERVAAKLDMGITGIITRIEEAGLQRDNRGRGLNPFPQVPELEADVGNLLIQANRYIKLLCELPQHFLALDRIDSNFDHLSKRLTAVLGEAAPSVVFVTTYAAGVRYVADLRNFHEHPRDTRTVIENFKVLPDGRISPPSWGLEGATTTDRAAIRDDALSIVSFLRDLGEEFFIHLLMHRISSKFPFFIEEVPDDKVDANLPVRYRLSIDPARLYVAPQREGA